MIQTMNVQAKTLYIMYLKTSMYAIAKSKIELINKLLDFMLRSINWPIDCVSKTFNTINIILKMAVVTSNVIFVCEADL